MTIIKIPAVEFRANESRASLTCDSLHLTITQCYVTQRTLSAQSSHLRGHAKRNYRDDDNYLAAFYLPLSLGGLKVG